MLAVNLWGVIHGTKEFLPHLIDSGDGQVVNISSLNGFLAQPGMSAYCTAKFGVRGFTEVLRAEVARDRLPVRIMVVHPGGVRTNIATAALCRAAEQGEPVTDADEKATRFYNEKLLRMDPAEAAGIILDAVAAGRSRVLVGADARAVDTLVRMLPARAPRVAAWLDRRVRP
ncbi:MAG: SDR family NAD(P)-dependent oxidoreductase [Tetrasphaera sp.]